MTITFEQGAAIATQTFSYDADGSRATVTDDLSDIERFADAHLSKLQAGNLAYNTPEKMKTGQTARVIARLGSDKVYISSLTAGMATDKESRTEILKTLVSVKMKMTLKGADFVITPLSSEEQFVGGDAPTTWEWEVAPKHQGKLRLHLAAIVIWKDGVRDFTTADRDITVQVDPVDEAEKFVEKNLIWILGGLGTGLGTAWAWWKTRKKPVPPNWQTP